MNKPSDQVQVEDIIIPEDFEFPDFANAIRILPEPGGDCIIEFLIYIATTKKAKVLSRVRVRNDFLLVMRNTINNILPAQHQQPVVHSSGQLVTPDGEGVAIFHPPWTKDEPGEGN